MRLHIGDSSRCRAVFGELHKTKPMQKMCKEAAKLWTPTVRAEVQVGPQKGRGRGGAPSSVSTAHSEGDAASSRGSGGGRGASRPRAHTLPVGGVSGENEPGVGADIVDMRGRLLGRVTLEEKRGWRLSDGRIAKRTAEGRRWRWSLPPTQVALGLAVAAEESSDDDSVAPTVSVAPTPSSSVAMSPLMLVQDDVAGINAFALPGPALPLQPEDDYADYGLPEHELLLVCDWLPLRDALRLASTCRSWTGSLTGHIPLMLPPPQVDALLQFCLLEVLAVFDDDRLPLPISAVYSEMRAVARRVASDPRALAHLEASVCRDLGPASKAQQRCFLREGLGRPHHVRWQAEIKISGFRTLERFAKHFSNERLIKTVLEHWHKRIHHSPNVRKCNEWILAFVHRGHPLFLEHARWRSEEAVSGPEAAGLEAVPWEAAVEAAAAAAA